MADDTIITCEDCGNEFEEWTSSGGLGQLFCPKCGSDCTEDDGMSPLMKQND